MTDLQGRSIKLSDYAGKPVFLNFWATWCGPCVSEMKSIEQVAQRFNNDLVFLAASNEPMELIQSFAKKHPQSFQFVRMEPTYLDVYVVKLPTTFLIDRHGQLVAEEEGFRDWSSQSSLNMLENLIKK